MIRIILPVLLLLVASCQAPQNSQSNNLAEGATASQASMPEGCDMKSGEDCGMKGDMEGCDMDAKMEGCDEKANMEGCDMDAKMEGCDEKANMEGCDMKGDMEGCDMKGGAAATKAGMEDCAMSGTGACEDGGDCPMKAACDAGVSACGDDCDMEGSNNATATQALLIEASAMCEGCTAEKMCGDCDTAIKAMWANCESCTEGSFCDDCLTKTQAAIAGGGCGGEAGSEASCETTETTKASHCDTPKG